MSIFKNKAKKTDRLTQLASSIKSNLTMSGVASRHGAGQLVSMESLTDADRDQLETSLESAVNVISDAYNAAFENLDVAAPGMDNASMQAAAIAALASADPSTYARTAMVSAAQAGTKNGAPVNVIESELSGAYGSVDFDTKVEPALESYDERNLTEYSHYSVVFNMQASRQDPFGEAFFPTVTVSPDQGGLDITIQNQVVMREYRHAATGRAADFKKRGLTDAFVDHTLLADEDTKIVPYRATDNSNQAAFIASALVAPYNVTVAGIAIPTAPYKIGEELDILGLSQHPSLLSGGVMDNTDAVDARLAISALYLDTGNSEPAAKLSLANLPRVQFNKSPEGHYRETVLQFTTRDILIDGTNKAVDGTNLTAFAAIASNNFRVRLAVDVQGTANLETGNVTVSSSKLRIVEIRNQAGDLVDTSAGAGATVAAALAGVTVAGYDLEARRTNSNRRTRGILLNTDYFTERFAVPLGSPISVPRPVNAERDAADLKLLVNTARVRNSNDAVTTLFNYADTLRTYVRGPKFAETAPAVIGSGRHYVTAFYEEHTLDMLDAINSTKSHEKAADVSAAMINGLRDVLFRMIRDSKYLAALQVVTGGTEEMPRAVIGTDSVIARHLMVSGDTRTFGELFKDFDIVHSQDRRMRNTIFVTLSRRGAPAPDPLSFGCMAWMPELTSAVDITRSGSLSREVMVQPRKLHIPLLPILAKITITNLSQALGQKIGTPDVHTLTSDWGDDVLYP